MMAARREPLELHGPEGEEWLIWPRKDQDYSDLLRCTITQFQLRPGSGYWFKICRHIKAELELEAVWNMEFLGIPLHLEHDS